MNNQQTVRALSSLYRIVEAGEKGYAVSAANVVNPGLKVLFKSYAQQRARFKTEIHAEINRLGGNINPRGSIRGILHRGRIDIFASLTTGNNDKEILVFKEILVGEKVAVKTYEWTLKKELPAETREIIEAQFEEVNKVIDRVKLMIGKENRRLIVRLFDAASDADKAEQELKHAGLHFESAERIVLQDSIELYSSRGTTTFETCASGAVGGALWGNLIGAMAGLGAEKTAALSVSAPSADVWYFFALAGFLAGAFIGGFLGFMIGIGISEEDAYQYDKSMHDGRIILLALVDHLDASKVGHVLERVNLEAKSLVRGGVI